MRARDQTSVIPAEMGTGFVAVAYAIFFSLRHRRRAQPADESGQEKMPSKPSTMTTVKRAVLHQHDEALIGLLMGLIVVGRQRSV